MHGGIQNCFRAAWASIRGCKAVLHTMKPPDSLLSNQQCIVTLQSPLKLRHLSSSNTIESRYCTNIKQSWTDFQLIHMLDSVRTQWKLVVNARKTRSSWPTMSLCHNLAYEQNESLEGARQLEDKSQQQRQS